VRVGVAATPAAALPTLDWLNSSEHELALIITQPDRPAGRGRNLRESVVGTWARSHDISMVKPDSAEFLLDKLTDVDIVVTIGYGVILPMSIITIPEFGFINLHFSLLPAWRGAAPVQRAILHGDTVSGVTVFQLDAGMDTGPIYVSRELEIDGLESAGQLLERMAALGPTVISAAFDKILRNIAPLTQSEEGVSYAAKVHKVDARIDWNNSADLIERQVRAFTPNPGAWTTWRGSSLKVTNAHVAHSPTPLMPGDIFVKDGLLLVGCGSREAIEVKRLTPIGKREMPVVDWLNGARLIAGESLV
jgi:methionyl-tRNA formyltransferase